MPDAHAFPKLLSPGRIGSLELRNRIVLAPMGTNLEAEDGTPGERISRFYEARARGGAGMIVVGVTGVIWPSGVSNPRNMGLSGERHVEAFRALTRRIHAQGARIAVQLQHAGKTSLQDVAVGRPLWVPSPTRDAAGDLFDALAPDEVARVTEPFTAPGAKLAYHVMSEADAAQVCRWFADAAERARAAGFDGIELHAGHGYLLSAFLSLSTNKREDRYGGPLENRARLLVEVIGAVRERVGPDFPLWCRLDGVEYGKVDGITEEEAARTAELAVAAGLDAIHVSAYADPRSAIAFTDAPLPHAEGRYLGLAARIKARVPVPVIAVGRVAPERAEAVLAAGEADFIAMGRKLIADPDLPRRLSVGRSPRPCVYAYRCVGNVFLRGAASCVVNPEAGEEPLADAAVTQSPRRVLVVGGGPAGMEASRRLADAGHTVTLCEARDRLGGLLIPAAEAEPANAALLAHLEEAVLEAGVEVRLGAAVDANAAARLSPDSVVLAVGAEQGRSALGGLPSARVLTLSDLADGLEVLLGGGPRVVVVGGELIGVELAEWLLARGAEVTLLEAGDRLALEMAPPRRWRALHALREGGADIRLGARDVALDEQGVCFLDAGGRSAAAPADRVVVTGHRTPAPALARALAARGLPVHEIGDGREPGIFEGAFRDSARVAREI